MTLFLFKHYGLTKNKFHSEPPTKFSKRGGGGLTGSQFFRVGVLEKKGSDFFRGRGCSF